VAKNQPLAVLPRERKRHIIFTKKRGLLPPVVKKHHRKSRKERIERYMSVDKIKCLDCGAEVGKRGKKGTIRCGPCGARYSGAVTERRQEGRLMIKHQGIVKYKGMETPKPVLVENHSHRGARIRYTGDTSLFYNRRTHDDSMLILVIEELKLHTFAKVVWTASVNNKESRLGLRFFWQC
jgi:ribosomal protein L37AE/L43A